MDLNWKSIVMILIILVAGAVLLNCCDSSGSSSGKKWSDLSEQEKENARWAYEVNRYIEDNE